MKKKLLLSLATLVAAVGVVAVASLAGAQLLLPAKNALLGGGKIGPRFPTAPGAGHPDVAFTTIRVDKKTGTSVHLYGEWPAPCKGRGAVAGIFDQDVPLKANGTFAGAGVVPKTAAVPHGVHYAFTGSFTSATAAQVVGALSFTLVENGKSAQCAGKAIKTQVRIAPKVTGKPAPKAGATYYGTTGDTGSVVLRVAAGGKSVAQVGEEGWLDCKTKKLKKNGGPFFQNISPPAKIAADGTFGGEERFDSPRSFLPGTVTHMHSVIKGRFGASGVGGTWTVEAKVVDKATGATTDTCTRKVTWAASL